MRLIPKRKIQGSQELMNSLALEDTSSILPLDDTAVDGRTKEGITSNWAYDHAALTTHVPSGFIGMWHGTIANIPSGYVVCDGNNSTPNLLARFVQGVATAATNPGATGGEATHTLITAEMPAHTHICGSASVAASTGTNQYVPYSDGSITTSSTGGGGAHQNEPPFYDVAFIMKT